MFFLIDWPVNRLGKCSSDRTIKPYINMANTKTKKPRRRFVTGMKNRKGAQYVGGYITRDVYEGAKSIGIREQRSLNYILEEGLKLYIQYHKGKI